MLLSNREIIKENLLLIIEKGEILLSSNRYDELLEIIISALKSFDEEDKKLNIYRFLDLFKEILFMLKIKNIDILDFLITAIDILKSYEDEIEDLNFENIDIDTFILQSSKQALLNKNIIENLSILNLLQKNKLKYFLQHNDLNLKIFTELKDIHKIDIVLSPPNKSIIQKIRKTTDKPIVILTSNTKETFDEFENIFYLSNKLDEDEFNESLIQILNTYECEYIKNKTTNLEIKPLSQTIMKLKDLDENASLREISKIISQDIALSTKIVSYVNKPYFGVIKEISSVNQAITFLGKEKTLAFAFSLGISENLGIELDFYNLNEDKFNKINFLRLKLATLWYRKINFSDYVVISSAAMLGNIGKLYLNKILKDLDTIKQEKFKTFIKIDRIFAEKEILDTSTEEISALLLNKWGFSNILVDSIYYANNIENSLPEIRNLSIANYVIFNTFENDIIDENIVKNMCDFLKEMNFDSNLYLQAIEKIKEEN